MSFSNGPPGQQRYDRVYNNGAIINLKFTAPSRRRHLAEDVLQVASLLRDFRVRGLGFAGRQGRFHVREGQGVPRGEPGGPLPQGGSPGSRQ